MKNIKLLILDCDGVFSDGKIMYDNHRVETKAFSAKDGLGIKILSFTDVKLAIITGRKSNILEQRCEDLGIKYLFQNIKNKVKVTKKLLAELGLDWENVAYLGDDWNDYPVIKKVGFSGTPNDAFDLFKEKVDFVCQRNGGEGVVREFIIHILTEQGIYEETVEKLVKYLENV
ncbi:MAG: HAD hydrolase family protein [Candidatus Cloacimonetes bacterium]|nr:HAD hydrolase family protein [Candidatus Cloacimonadota bacterium]